MPVYRRRNEGNTWHWHRDCSNWPKSDYKEVHSKPRKGEFCKHCKAKDEQMLKLFRPVKRENLEPMDLLE